MFVPWYYIFFENAGYGCTESRGFVSAPYYRLKYPFTSRMNRSYYLGIYLPLLIIFSIFYAMVMIVIFLKQKDKLLGSTFFRISLFLGIVELGTVSRLSSNIGRLDVHTSSTQSFPDVWHFAWWDLPQIGWYFANCVHLYPDCLWHSSIYDN